MPSLPSTEQPVSRRPRPPRPWILAAFWLVALAVFAAFAVWAPSADADALPADSAQERAQAIQHPVMPLQTTDVDGMRFHYEPRHDPVVQPLRDTAIEARDKILADLSPHALDDVDIYVIERIEDYFHAQNVPPRSPHWASGLAILQQGVILIRLEPQGTARLELDRTLAHELSHIALHRHAGGRYLPTWFVEGFALLQTEEWSLDRAGPLAEAALIDRLIPLYELNRGFPESAQRAQLAYAESAHFVRWLIQERGRDDFRAFTARLAAGEPFFDAFEAQYERDFFSYERQWRNQFEVEGGWLAIVVGSTTLFFATSLLFVGIYLRIRRRRKKQWAAIKTAPRADLPDHLKNFGPFAIGDAGSDGETIDVKNVHPRALR